MDVDSAHHAGAVMDGALILVATGRWKLRGIGVGSFGCAREEPIAGDVVRDSERRPTPGHGAPYRDIHH